MLWLMLRNDRFNFQAEDNFSVVTIADMIKV